MRRGIAAIGLDRPKDPQNLGGVLRAAHCFGAAMVATRGNRVRIKRSHTDTTKAWRHMPLIHADDLMEVCPYACVPVVVEVAEGATQLCTFKHPESAFYIFGPEDGSVSEELLGCCKHVVSIPTRFCLNLAATVNIVLYDRLTKTGSAA